MDPADNRFYREKPARSFNWLDPFAQFREERLARVDVSIAKQLQTSMELNARMKNRLLRLGRVLSGLEGELPRESSEIETAMNRLVVGNAATVSILKDEEPTW